jgi:hypothetical protein
VWRRRREDETVRADRSLVLWAEQRTCGAERSEGARMVRRVGVEECVEEDVCGWVYELGVLVYVANRCGN